MVTVQLDERLASTLAAACADLVRSVRVRPVNERARPTFVQDVVPARSLSKTDIKGEIKHFEVDGVGRRASRYFVNGQEATGLFGPDYERLERLAEFAQQSLALRPYVTRETVAEVLFDWIRSCYSGDSRVGVTQSLVQHVNSVVRNVTIWIPITLFHVESAFLVGRVRICTLSKERLDHWLEGRVESAATRDLRKRVQGYAATATTHTAEPQRAAELAFTEVEEVLMLLRALSPEALAPELTSHCVPLGLGDVPTKTYLVAEDERLISASHGAEFADGRPRILRNNEIAMFLRAYATPLRQTLLSTQRSQFERSVLDSLALYSRSTLARDMSDRLVYVFVSLESLLLKSDGENSIAKKVARRFARLVAVAPEQQDRIAADIRALYRLRSRFVHHGQRIRDLELLKICLLHVFCFYQLVASLVSRFESKEAFIVVLDGQEDLRGIVR